MFDIYSDFSESMDKKQVFDFCKLFNGHQDDFVAKDKEAFVAMFSK